MSWEAMHQPCPKCPSTDGYSIDEKGNGYCFVCETWVKGDGTVTESVEKVISNLIPTGEYTALSKRNLSLETCKKFGYFITTHNDKVVQVANYYNSERSLVGQKVRTPNKEFSTKGDFKSVMLFGQQLWKAGGKRVVITEGELDAMSVSQIQGNTWPVVSLPSGSSSAAKAIKNNIEFLSSFEEIVLMFDNDKAGQEAVSKVKDILPVGKGRIAELPLKDANDMLVAGRSDEVVKAIWNAKEVRPDGIVSGRDLLPLLLEKDETKEHDYPFTGINQALHGIRPREIVTITSGSGMGKSQLTREIAYNLMQDGASVGYIALEEGVKKSALGMLSLAANKPLHLLEQDNEERERLFNQVLLNNEIYFYDHFGSADSDNLISKIRYLVVGMGCKYIFLDHISIMVSGIEEGDERRIIDNMMTKLRSLVEELGCGMFVISHLKRPKGDKGHEEGAQTSLAQLRGSAAIAQLSDIVIGMERNQQAEESANISTIRVLKNRLSGETGLAGYISYDKSSGRMTDSEAPVLKDEEDF